MPVHRAVHVAERAARLRSGPPAEGGLPRIRQGAGHGKSAVRRACLPQHPPEPPVVHVRPHAAPPEHAVRERPPVPRRQLRGHHGRQPRPLLRVQGDLRLLPRTLFKSALLREGPGIQRPGAPRHLGVPSEPDARRGVPRLPAHLGDEGLLRELLFLRPELLVQPALPDRGGQAVAAAHRRVLRQVAVLGDPGGHGARRAEVRDRRPGDLPSVAGHEDPADRREHGRRP